MSASNETTNLHLSQFAANDKPTWQGDYNSDMQKIDAAYAGLEGDSGTISTQVEANTNSISQLNGSVNGLQQSINSHTVAIQNNANRITNNETDINMLQSEMENAQEDIAMLSNNDEWVILGDNYGTNSSNYMSYIKQLNPNRTIYNLCKAGAGFTVTSNSFLINLQNAISGIKVGKVGKVIVIGGGNDINATSSSILTAINTFSNYVKSTFPNARLYVGFLWGDARNTHNPSNVANCILSYMSALTEYGDTWISGLENIGKDYSLFDDAADKHSPNQMGSKMVGNMISSFLNTGTALNFSRPSITNKWVAAENITIGSNAGLNERLKNGTVYINLLPFTLTPSVTIASKTLFATYGLMYENSKSVDLPFLIIESGEDSIEATITLDHGSAYINPHNKVLNANTTYNIKTIRTSFDADYC